MDSHSNLVVLLDPNHTEAAPQEYTDSDAAFDFLKQASRIKPNMVHFTQCWEKLRPKRLKDKTQTDREILRGLAGLMASGKLVLKDRNRGGGGGSDDDKPGKASPAPAARRKRPIYGEGLKIRDRPDPPAPPPPPPAISVAEQVEALRAAALAGTPFCEQCARTA